MSHVKTKQGINKNYKYLFNSNRDLAYDTVTPTLIYKHLTNLKYIGSVSKKF